MVAVIPPAVCDSSVVSVMYVRDRRTPFYEGHLTRYRAVISFQTLEELYRWPIRNNWGSRRQGELMQYIEQYEVIWPNPDLAYISAQLRTEQERAGRRLNTADAWIASTAIMLGCPLIADDGDFSGIPNLELIRAPTP